VSAGDNEQCGALLTTFQASAAARSRWSSTQASALRRDLPHDGNVVTLPEAGTDAGRPSVRHARATTSPSADCQKCTTNCETSNDLADACDSYYACFCRAPRATPAASRRARRSRGIASRSPETSRHASRATAPACARPTRGADRPAPAPSSRRAATRRSMRLLGTRDAGICAAFGQMSEATCRWISRTAGSSRRRARNRRKTGAKMKYLHTMVRVSNSRRRSTSTARSLAWWNAAGRRTRRALHARLPCRPGGRRRRRPRSSSRTTGPGNAEWRA